MFMVTINYQSFGTSGFQLRLRLYQDGETKFIVVTKMLKGNIQKRHWNQKKQQFIPSCPFSEENNKFLYQFRQKYDDAAINWSGSVYGLMAFVDDSRGTGKNMLLTDYIKSIVEELKQRRHVDGSIKGSYEGYVKLDKRLEEFCVYKNIKYDRLQITDIRPSFVNDVFSWIVN